MLGIRGLDDDEHQFLPDTVVGAVQETFPWFQRPDRLTMALAFTRVVQNLLSAALQLARTRLKSRWSQMIHRTASICSWECVSRAQRACQAATGFGVTAKDDLESQPG